MAIDVRVVGTNPINHKTQPIEVGTKGFVQVAVREGDPPPPGEVSRFRFYAQYLGLNGKEDTSGDGGDADMGVDGSGTPQEFYIESEQDFDIRIMEISILLADTAVAHNNFGNVGALGTGWDLKIKEAGTETFIINKAQTGGQIIAQSGFAKPYGDGATSFELLNWTGTADAQTISIPMGQLVPGGLRIGRGTRDRLVAIVNDDLTGLTEFYCRVMGYRHFA